ncbi:MAG: hypothetical protein ALECFALPRED_001399 [Alectoria fallacina]|uniref:Transmembrane protein n=1 Tax=Alectoria fallacina TaxID=1903189 RepID=A0A8H3JAX1_9LECA|nr:MAG: hypothetical protein ALECFALPRED_001399 [Alectoria fallacina]
MSNGPLISNGSFTLDPFVANSSNTLSNGSYPFNASLHYSFPSGNLDWATPRADLGVLTYDPSKTNMWAIGKTVDLLFQPSVFSYEQKCIYAISGQYGFLPRLIYYLLLIFSLILRKQFWLSTAALGTAMTYAATASVHAFALLLRYRYHTPTLKNLDWIYLPPKELGDIDLQAIFPILVAGSIMLTPILLFSTTVREHEAHSVIIFWGVLVYCAMVPTFAIVIKGVVPSVILSQLSTCALDVAKGCTFENLSVTNNGVSLNLYNRCNCTDTCGAFDLPHTPLRHNQGASALLISDTIDILTGSKLVIGLFVANSMFLLWITGQGILGLIQNQWDQVTVRNWAFRTFAGSTPKRDRTTFGSKLRYYFGKTVAGYYFLIVIAVAFICPFVFVSSVIINEIITWSWPVSESEDAVGQWSTWVSACFVIIAAIIQKYHHAWLMSIKLGCATVVHIIKWICGKESFRKEPQELRTKENSVMEDLKEFFRQCAKPFTHSWNSILNTLRQLRAYWQEFKQWHHDPVGVSTRVLAQQTPSISGSTEVKVHSVHSSEEASFLESNLEHAPPHQVPLSAFATLPPHTTLSPIGSHQPKSTPLSRSQSSVILSNHYTSPWSSETENAPYKPRSSTGDAHTSPRPLQPFPRSAYSSTKLPPSQDSSDLLTVRRHHTDPIMPPQAAWAPTALQPQQRRVA